MNARVSRVLLAALTALAVVPGDAVAHGGGLAMSQAGRLAVPTWLFLLTGGATVGASFLLASFVTDPGVLRSVHAWQRSLDVPRFRTLVSSSGRAIGVLGLSVVVVAGLFGPREPLRNASILLVWGGWWAGYTMTVYLLGNSWPSVNPFRTVARPLGDGRVAYPDWLDSWPATIGLLLLVWLEVVSPLATDPRVLAAGVLGYLAVTLVGAFLFGVGPWFRHVDPVSGVFRQYGTVAPIRRSEGGLRWSLPSSALVAGSRPQLSEAGLIVALLWGTTYDGIVQTPLWETIARALVTAGVPPAVLYPAVLLLGFLVFVGLYWIAVRSIRRVAPTCLSATTLARTFAPSLVAIAAGYHLAHFLGYVLSLTPAFFNAILHPLDPPTPVLLSLPGWFGGLSVLFVLGGHFLAIWVAHGVAFDRFPGRVQAIRSQFPLTAVMVLYTMVSLWIVTRPYSQPPYL